MRAIPSLGQNFLVSPHTIRKIVSVAESHSPSTILEIGPGKGALTFPLAQTVKVLHCIEKDGFLASELLRTTANSDCENITIHTGDVLEFDLNSISPTPFHIVGALPFNISKKIIALTLRIEHTLAPFVHTVVQKEVALSYTTPPPKADFLYHFAQIYGKCSLNFTIPKNHFSPIPSVDAACITFEKKPRKSNHGQFASFIKSLYSKPRKTLKNNIAPLLDPTRKESELHHFDRVADLQKRPATLTHDELNDLFFVYNKLYPDETETI